MKFFRSYTNMSHFITRFFSVLPACLSDIPFDWTGSLYRHTHTLFLSRKKWVMSWIRCYQACRACLPDFRLYRSYRRSLIILRPRCIQHHIKVTLLFSRDSRHPDTDSRPRKARCHSPDSNSSHTLIHPGTTANPSVTSAEASAPGHIPARSGAVSAAMPGLQRSERIQMIQKPVSHGRFLFLFTEYNGHSIDSFPAPYSNQPLKPQQWLNRIEWLKIASVPQTARLFRKRSFLYCDFYMQMRTSKANSSCCLSINYWQNAW